MTQGAGREGDRSHNILYTVVRTGRVPASNILYDADKRGPSARASETIRGTHRGPGERVIVWDVRIIAGNTFRAMRAREAHKFGNVYTGSCIHPDPGIAKFVYDRSVYTGS